MAPVAALATIAALVSMALTAAPSWAATTPCTGPVGAIEIKGNVSAGAGCDLSGATVTGNVTVNPGGSLATEARSTTVIQGNLTSSQATAIILEGATSVHGNATLTGTSGETYLSGKVNGNLTIEGGLSLITLQIEAIQGNLKIVNTSGSGFVGIRSTVGGNAEVSNNSLNEITISALLFQESTVRGNLRIDNNSATGALFNAVTVRENDVGGNTEVRNNTAGNTIAVTLNTIVGSLKCEGNEPPPTGEGNTASKKLGQCELL
jgi:hypothetical protein